MRSRPSPATLGGWGQAGRDRRRAARAPRLRPPPARRAGGGRRRLPRRADQEVLPPARELRQAQPRGQRRRPASRETARALADRTRPSPGPSAWSGFTTCPAAGGWTSGLAQAVAAQALARAGRKEEARRAFLAIPDRLLIRLPQGPWIKLYGYSNVVVLNAQLQAALSIGHYARLTNDTRACSRGSSDGRRRRSCRASTTARGRATHSGAPRRSSTTST